MFGTHLFFVNLAVFAVHICGYGNEVFVFRMQEYHCSALPPNVKSSSNVLFGSIFDHLSPRVFCGCTGPLFGVQKSGRLAGFN